MLGERLKKQIVLFKSAFLFILYNRAVRDFTKGVNVLNLYYIFAALKLRHCGGSAVTQVKSKSWSRSNCRNAVETLASMDRFLTKSCI